MHGIDLSRDGLWLLLPQAVPGGSDLFKIPVGGGAPVRLTRSGLVYGGLWSPDGLFAAFLSPEGDSLRIRLVNADGRSSGPIRGVDPGLPFFPSWGDDRLVLDRSDNLLESVTNLTVQYGQETFTGWQPVEPSPSGEPPTSTFIVDADRSPLVSSTRHRAWSGSAATGADSTALSGWMIWPFVSPDGDKVLFWWSRQAGQEPLGTWWWIAAGPEPELVPFSTVNSPQEWPVGWSRDGTAIYWKVGREIHRWGLDGGRDFLLRLPEGRISCKPRPDKDAPEFLCVEDLSYAELFLVENFDSGGI